MPDLHDTPRFTVSVLLIALARKDKYNLKVCVMAVLRSAFHHLYASYNLDTPEDGEAMSTMISLRWEIEEDAHVG
jgi:Flp pilus assembly secretin CpaC